MFLPYESRKMRPR